MHICNCFFFSPIPSGYAWAVSSAAPGTLNYLAEQFQPQQLNVGVCDLVANPTCQQHVVWVGAYGRIERSTVDGSQRDMVCVHARTRQSQNSLPAVLADDTFGLIFAIINGSVQVIDMQCSKPWQASCNYIPLLNNTYFNTASPVMPGTSSVYLQGIIMANSTRLVFAANLFSGGEVWTDFYLVDTGDVRRYLDGQLQNVPIPRFLSTLYRAATPEEMNLLAAYEVAPTALGVTWACGGDLFAVPPTSDSMWRLNATLQAEPILQPSTLIDPAGIAMWNDTTVLFVTRGTQNAWNGVQSFGLDDVRGVRTFSTAVFAPPLSITLELPKALYVYREQVCVCCLL